MAQLFASACPDCGGHITFRFALLVNVGVGVFCFARCKFCFARGDERSARLFVELDDDAFIEAAHNGLYILNYKSAPPITDDENIADLLDDEEDEK